MAAVVSLEDVLTAMDVPGQDWESFLDPETGEIITVTEEDRHALENSESDHVPDWQRDHLPRIREALESDRCLRLPDSSDINAWSVMKRFCHTVAESSSREELLDAIHGRGAFRMFQRTLERLDLREKWYSYRQAAFEEIARNWLEENHIPYK